jgi:hypothetical protein
MTTITPPNIIIDGQPIATQTLIELRAQTALFQTIEGTSQEGQVNVDMLRLDAAFDMGIPGADIIP